MFVYLHAYIYIYIYTQEYFWALDIMDMLRAEIKFLNPRAEADVCQCFV